MTCFEIPLKDEEIAVVSHNDPHPGNMMMDRNDTTAESLILIDWDLTQYGYRPSFTKIVLTGQTLTIREYNVHDSDRFELAKELLT